MIGYRAAPRPRQTQTGTSASQSPSTNFSRRRRHKPDYGIAILTALLMAIGLILIYSISPALADANVDSSAVVRHKLVGVALAAVAFVAAAAIPFGVWDKYKKPLIGAAIIVTLIAIITPVNPQFPAHRWIRFGGLSFQTVELVKFALLIWLSAFLVKQKTAGKIDDFNTTLRPLIFILLGGGLVIAGLQSDLGSAAVLAAMMGIMAFVAGLPIKKVAIALMILAALGSVAILSTPYRRERVATFLNPTADCQDSGYQACQALISIGSGGFAGLGLGRSVQAYGYLPAAANDSIFAIYAEKFGFIGSIVLLGIFAELFRRLTKIAERAPDLRTRLIVVGVLTWLAVQAIINIGAMIGLLPLKGITLPFISYGGTSLIFMAAAMGLVFQISRFADFTSPLDGRKGRSYR